MIRGQTEANRKVEVRAEISGGVISKPRQKGAKILENETLCEIAAGTRYVTLNEAKMRLIEAERKSNVVQSLGEKGYSTETNKLTQKTILEGAKASLARAEYEISKLIRDSNARGENSVRRIEPSKIVFFRLPIMHDTPHGKP